MARYVVLHDDAHGRPTYGFADDPIEYLARRVAADLMTPKAAKAVAVYEIRACDIDEQVLTARIERCRYLYLVRSNRLVVLDGLAKGSLTPDDVEVLRDELRAVFPLGAWDPPWPHKSETDEPMEAG